MNLDLSVWKDALKKHGIECVDSPHGSFQRLDVCLPSGVEDYVTIEHLYDKSDDHSAAEFISRVTEKVFGEFAWYQPVIPDKGPWELYAHDDEHCGIGASKLDALLNALQSLPVKEEGS